MKDLSSHPPLELEQIAEDQWDIDHIRAGRFFDDYLKGGILPFSREEPEPFAFPESILEKVITRDIPSAGRIMVDELESIRRLRIYFLTYA